LNAESQNQLAWRHTPLKVTSGAENLVLLQALQFQEIRFCRELPDGACIGDYWRNGRFWGGGGGVF